MEEDFGEENMENLKTNLRLLLTKPLLKKGFAYLIYLYPPKPLVISTEKKDFWGGYVLEFKVIGSENMIT